MLSTYEVLSRPLLLCPAVLFLARHPSSNITELYLWRKRGWRGKVKESGTESPGRSISGVSWSEIWGQGPQKVLQKLILWKKYPL